MTVETLIALPILAVAVFTVIQTALWGVALIGARAAADGAARDSADYGASAHDAHQSATGRLHAVAGRWITDPHVTVAAAATTVTVTVSGRCPLLPLPVSWTATAPKERFTP